MGVSAGPRIETDGLVFAFDAKNTKTFDDIPGITDHGISDWYCFLNGTTTYSAIYPNTEIIEIDADGNETVLVTTGSDPQRGTFTTTSGRRYYGTKAIHLLQTSGTGSDEQHELAPVSFAGTYFAHYWSRNSPTTYYAYAPQDDTTLEFFDNNATGGVTGTATATHNISRGLTTSFQSTAQGTWQFFKADKPIIMTAGGTGWDKTILAPATQYIYKRRNANNRTINNTAPSNAGTYVTWDTSLLVATVEIADGAGGDCTQGVGYEYLSDTYSWGDVLSDYQIVAPYADTTVTVSYWANSQWNVGEVHSLSGTQTSPAAVDRDGTNGFGVDGTIISGQAANLASNANLWKWESTKPIAVIINDKADDEERLLGWMSNNYLRTSSNVTQSFVNLINKGSRRRMKMRGKRLTSSSSYADTKLSAGDSIVFDGVDDEVICDIGSVLVKDFTLGFWMKSDASIEGRGAIEYGGSTYAIIAAYRLKTNSAQFYFGTTGAVNALTLTSVNLADNNWHYVVQSYDGTNARVYVDGNLELDDSSTFSGNLRTTSDNILRMGRWVAGVIYQDMELASVKVYNKALSALEIQQNFNALRGRFGI